MESTLRIDRSASKLQYHIREDNAWVKVLDGVLGNIPILGGFTGYLFNPSYTVTDLKGEAVCQLKKNRLSSEENLNSQN